MIRITPNRAFFLILLVQSLLVRCSSPKTGDDRYADSAGIDSLLISAIKKTNELKFEQAHAELTHLIEWARAKGDSKNQVLGTINLGVLYLKYNAQDEALKYFLRSLELAEEFKREELLNTIYNNIGIVYSSNNAPGKAIEYFEKALAISRKQKNQHRIAINLLNLSTEVRKKGDRTLAMSYLRQSQTILLAHQDTLNASVALNNIGDIYYGAKEYDSALFQYRRSLSMSEKMNDHYYESEYCLNVGKTYYQLHRYDSSGFFLEKSLKGFNKTGSTENIIEGYTWLSKVNQAKGQTADALKYATASLAWKDTLLHEKTSKWISELQMRYEFGKKEKEIEWLQEQAQRQKEIWIGVIVGGVIISLLVFLILQVKNINLKQKNVILQQEQEVDRLTLEKNRAEREQLEKDIVANEKLNALEQQRLKQELTFKDRELAAKALHLVNKNETFASINKLLTTIDLQENQGKSQIDKVKKIIRENGSIDREWEAFKLHFEEVHPRFFSQLKETYPSLLANDLRLSAYLLIDLNAKEIAHIFNISPESIRKKKQRLRQKLNLKNDEDIKTLLSRFKAAE
jgi:tetratricopeptide (TPR) repeat protein